MRWIPVAAIILVSASVALLPAGCGGSEAQDVLSSRAGPASTVPGSSGSGTSGSGTSGTSGTSGSTDASVDSSTSCPAEQEPNNGRDDANQLAPTRCGNIQPNSEADWLTFQLKPASTTMQIKFDGKVTLRVEVDNQSVILGGAVGGGKVPFVKGKTYYIEIKATIRDNAVPWRVDLIEQ